MRSDRELIVSIVTHYLAARPDVLFAYVFGSVVESGSFEDVDVAVYRSDELTNVDGLEYTIKMSVELERKVGLPVDVVPMNTAPSHIVHSISKGMVVVNRDDDARVDFITSSWTRYFDVQRKRQQAIVDMLS